MNLKEIIQKIFEPNYIKIYKQIEQAARKIDVKRIMPEPILVTEVRKKVIGNRRGLIVDDLDVILRMILDDNVYYATMEDCNIEKLERSK